MVALQETKLDHIDNHLVTEILGARFADNFTALPATGTRGGVLFAVDEDHFKIIASELGVYSVTVRVCDAIGGQGEWYVTAVYGPQEDQAKLQFLAELRGLKHRVSDKWLLTGDFNMILSAADKSNAILNRRLMGEFREAVNDLELKELNLQGRKFTWSNNHTQTRIDRVFCTAAWDCMMPRVHLQALSSRISDHSPLLLAVGQGIKSFRGFRFEAFWPRLPGFSEVVSAAWCRLLNVHNPFLRLHSKLQRVSKDLRRWSRGLLGRNKVLLCAVQRLIGILDIVQEARPLSDPEIIFRRDLKSRLLGLTAVEKLRAKQASRLVRIRAAEANEKLFYMQANGRRRKNTIHHIVTEEGTKHRHEDIAAAIYNHYSTHFGQPPQRDFTLNWSELGIITRDLSHLEVLFNEAEVHSVIQDLESDKAPGPDGFIGVFFKHSW
jgi:hypothetical protein